MGSAQMAPSKGDCPSAMGGFAQMGLHVRPCVIPHDAFPISISISVTFAFPSFYCSSLFVARNGMLYMSG